MSYLINHYEGVAVDFLTKLHASEKAQIKHAAKADLIYHNFTLGQQVRNLYDIWNNPELVKSTGKKHPDDASLVILVRVWEYLQEDDDPEIATPPTPMSTSKRASFQRAVDYYEETMSTKFSVQ